MRPDAAAPAGEDQDRSRRAVAAVWRIESARIIAALTRLTGDLDTAEDLAQDALTQALAQWPRDGVPANPGAWLTTVARRRAVDRWRRAERLEERYVQLVRDLAGQEEADWDPEQIEDDVLRLLFVACHPVLTRQAQVALTLRVVAGLTSEEIARAFLVPTATVQQRIVRAKRTLAEARVPFEVPPPREYPERLAGVLAVIYLVFNEGYAASSGDRWVRPGVADEARRLGRVLAALVPREPEVHGLVALMEFQAARFPARTDAQGRPVLLADQDRRRWDRSAIQRGDAALERADALGRGRGSYGLQAAIAQCHAHAPSTEETDWARIVLLYEALGQLSPSPVVELNRAAALAMAEGPGTALREVDRLVASGRLRGYHLLPSVRGELLARLGRHQEARTELTRAAAMTANERERDLLLAKAADQERAGLESGAP
ncbi:RNA polymerase sigma factor [Ornithinicoccus halotolerans]|uniref:RNA polymerase sigma factor n=1 Tax=Ornithinicoccus halotolerans TaxID=1748220 RepID=UPI0012954054|nr:RNA polymerase sigma factor [Ornithinicoccus halotolerans]